jgi:hypothetical protein
MSRNYTEPIALLVVLLVIAVSINLTREGWRQRAAQRQEQHQQEIASQIAAQKVAQEQAQLQKQREVEAQQAAEEAEAARQKAAEEAAAEHAQYLARYLNSGFVKQSGVETIAVVAASENGKFNSAVSDALASRFKSKAVETLPSFFKLEFISDGLFNDAFNGIAALSQKLELGKFLDGLLLAREEVTYSPNSSSLDNVITATMQVEIELVPVSSSLQDERWTFTATGAGFKNEEARALAEERIIKQISTDTKMSLNP